MTKNEAADYWQKRAQAELKGALVLFENQDPDLYGEVIFHCHLALELGFKARYIQEHDAAAPFTHSLGLLARSLDEEWSQRDEEDFDRLTDSAVLARYGDSQWHTQNATKENAAMWLAKVEKFLLRIHP